MRILLVTTSVIIALAGAAIAENYTHGEPVYDLSGRVPLAYGKNKKGEDVVCEHIARTGSNLKTWTCQSVDDKKRAEVAFDEAWERAQDSARFEPCDETGCATRGVFGVR